MFTFGMIVEGKPINNVTVTTCASDDDRSHAAAASFPRVDGFAARFAHKLPEVVMRNARNRWAADGATDVRLFPVA